MGLGCDFFCWGPWFSLSTRGVESSNLAWTLEELKMLGPGWVWSNSVGNPFRWALKLLSTDLQLSKATSCNKLQHLYIWSEIIYIIIYIYISTSNNIKPPRCLAFGWSESTVCLQHYTRRLVDPETTNPRISVLSRLVSTLEKSSVCGWSKSNVCPVEYFFCKHQASQRSQPITEPRTGTLQVYAKSAVSSSDFRWQVTTIADPIIDEISIDVDLSCSLSSQSCSHWEAATHGIFSRCNTSWFRF